jgi:hypothetical protein
VTKLQVPAEAVVGVRYLKVMKHVLTKGDKYLAAECDPAETCAVAPMNIKHM